MSSNHFKVVEVADIHFGNGRISPMDTYLHLEKYLYPELKDCNLMVVNGDTFDTMISLNSDAGFYVLRFIEDLLAMQKRHGYYLRVVRGTFSHDRNQNRVFVLNDDKREIDSLPATRVLDKMAMEVFPCKLKVLYRPDDLPSKDADQDVLDYLKSQHTKSVDLMFSHGCYRHLLPDNLPHLPTDTLDWEKMKTVVSGLAFNGHIHHAGIHDRIISSGSFERLDHGTPGKVGFWTAELKNGKWTTRFVENPDATEFRTFVFPDGQDEKASIGEVSSYLAELANAGYPEDRQIHIRVCDKSSILVECIKTLRKNLVVTIRPKSGERQVFEAPIRTDSLPDITPENLPNLVWEQLKDGTSLTKEEVEELINEL